MANQSERVNRRIGSAGVLLGVVVLIAAGTVQALDRTWTSDADFAAGATVDLVVGSDEITLDIDGVGAPDAAIPWWNPAWGQRRCLEITNNEPTTLDEFQIVLSLDTATPIAGARMHPAGNDIRFISADGSTELDHWIEGPINDAGTTIWVQTDTLPPGDSTLCMYYDNAAAPAQSDSLSPFVYSTPQDLYVAVSETQAGGAISVTSYVADNTISDGIDTVTLGVGGTHTFPANALHTAATVVSASGPIAIQGAGDVSDSFAPLAFAGTEFVIPTSRNVNRVSLYAPFADASVTIDASGTSTTVAVPAGTSVSSAADITSTTQAAGIRSDQPILVTHQAGVDAFVVVPASNEPTLGVVSTTVMLGYGGAATSVIGRQSDAFTNATVGGVGGAISRGGGGAQGTGPALLLTPTQGGPINAIQQADSDGGETTNFWPLSELNIAYRVPVAMDYVALACADVRTANLVSDGTTLSCAGTGGTGFPGKALDSSVLAAGSLIESTDGLPFYAYGEDSANNDENNILGPKQARLATANPPTAVIGREQSRFVPSGSWTSEVVDTTCRAFFGDLTWNPTVQPAGTAVEFQVATAPTATGPFTYLGPDGTAATTYVAGSGGPIADVHDGDQFVRVQSSLQADATGVAAPTITDITVGWVGETTITGTLFSDVAGDGTNAATDPGLDGIDVTLWCDDGDGLFDPSADTNVVTIATSGGGTYSFSGQPAATYFVQGSEAQLPAGHLTPGTTPNPAGPIAAGECGAAVADLGWQPTGSFTATVFSDIDGDGTLGADDVGLGATDVGLWRDNGDGAFDRTSDVRVAVTPTASDGSVAFSELILGDYFVIVDNGDEPTGHLVASTTNNPAGPLAVTTGSDTSAAIGFRPVGGLGGTVFADDNGDGIQQSDDGGVGQLFIDVYLDNGDGVFDPAVDVIVTTVHTNPLGSYLLAGAAPGDYWIVPFDPPLPSLPVAPSLATVAGADVTVADVALPQAQSITGSVIFDADGVPDAASSPAPGFAVSLHLDNGDGVFDVVTDPQVAVTTSNEQGTFVLTNVRPGNYFVQVGASALPMFGDTALVGDNPLGPVAPGADGLVFAFDLDELTLPETGLAAAAGALRIGFASILGGLALLVVGRRRISA